MDKHVDLSPGRSWHTQSKPAALIFDLDGTLADTDIPLFVHTYKPDSVTGVIVDLLLARANIAPSRRCSDSSGRTYRANHPPYGVNMLLAEIHISPSYPL